MRGDVDRLPKRDSFPPVRTAVSPKSPYGGIHRFEHKGRIWRSGVFVWGGFARMLQWKPKLIALMAILVLVAAVSGQFTWDSFEQFTWF